MRCFSNAIMLLAVFELGGCASPTIPVTYSAQNVTRLKGELSIGDFTYRPAVEKKVKPNQVQNTAPLGQIYIGANIADLAKRATALELEKSGVGIGEQHEIQVSGEVMEFKADDFGYSIDWTYSIQYKLCRMKDSQVLLNKLYVADLKHTGKTGAAADFAPSINEMILSAYEKFINDNDVRALLQPRQ